MDQLTAAVQFRAQDGHHGGAARARAMSIIQGILYCSGPAKAVWISTAPPAGSVVDVAASGCLDVRTVDCHGGYSGKKQQQEDRHILGARFAGV
uniref:Uncharacterized protein n=1 Tax=Oryza meridionalis TaxID=40149 RepID=A0A0E0BYC0_9ORYZ